jgi:hypothetical protein
MKIKILKSGNYKASENMMSPKRNKKFKNGEVIEASENMDMFTKKIKNFIRFSEEKIKKRPKNSQKCKKIGGGGLGVPEERSQRATTLNV